VSTDRELLELAAKASVIFLTPETLREKLPQWEWSDEYLPYYLESVGMRGTVVWYGRNGEVGGTDSMDWNPLTDDGDALRLAVKLNEYEPYKSSGGFRLSPGLSVDDQRRAIFRAAVEIGRAMK